MDENPQRLRWKHYVFAGIACYLMPLLISCIRSAQLLDSRAVRHTLLYRGIDFTDFFWMGVIAALSFLALLPSLKYPIVRLLVYGLICVGWLFLAGIFFQPSRSDIGGRSSNKPAAGNAGIASQLTIGHHWPGVPEPGRWDS